MSYESRKKKRAYKRRASKAKRSDKTVGRWYLTVAKRPDKCGSCGDEIGRAAEFVFRFEPRAVRCLRCADREGIRYRASARWERSRRVPKAA